MWDDAPLAPAPPDVDVDDWAAACAEVRGECGWHVAPEITETVSVPAAGLGALLLPTMRLVAVTAVTAPDSTVIAPDTLVWDVNGWVYGAGLALGNGGLVPQRYVVTFKHGHNTCPDDLLRVVHARLASIALPAGQFSAGPFSYASPQADASQVAATLARYTLPERP